MRKISFKLKTISLVLGKKHFDFLYSLGRGNKSLALRIMINDVMENEEMKKQLKKKLRDTRTIFE